MPYVWPATRTDKGILLAKELLVWLRKNNVMIPAINVVERTCAEAMAGGDKIVFQTLNAPLTPAHRDAQDRLLEFSDNLPSRLTWLLQPPGKINGKNVLQTDPNQCWTSFLDAGGLRDIEVEAVTKILACGTRISGVKEYGCDNPGCRHVKYITNACPSCGKKATDLWIAAQLNRLQDCDWIHLVFTLPDSLWPLFQLLNDLCRLAVDNLLYAADKRALDIGIFCAIHTYGRRLNWHPHVHVSVTCGGIDAYGKWKKISFRKDAMRARWMWNIRQLLLSVWSDGIAMPSSLSHITTESHYACAATLSFRYHDHKTGEQATETLTQREIVARLKQHIPEKFFRILSYFGFLANRVCGEKLPVVYSTLGMVKPEPLLKVCYAQMSKQYLWRDPFECVLCGGRMVYRRVVAGLNMQGLKNDQKKPELPTACSSPT